mmetsp:Transcript_16525/g.33771  ORF Transcript_16525/g.33771 Transcript_16525/m.33771 type:complete len:96 (+) Transcript_16525:208-495(+)
MRCHPTAHTHSAHELLRKQLMKRVNNMPILFQDSLNFWTKKPRPFAHSNISDNTFDHPCRRKKNAFANGVDKNLGMVVFDDLDTFGHFISQHGFS